MAKKNQSFDLGKYQSKKEKTVKVKKEKPEKIKKEKAVKLKSDKPIKIKQSKQDKGTKTKKSLGFKKNSEINLSNKSGNRKKPNLKLIIGIAIALVLIAAIVIVVVTTVKKDKEQGDQISYIAISSTPIKTSYYVGENPNYDGLRVNVTRQSGETFVVKPEECTITGFDSSAVNDNLLITVNYQGFIATYTVKIKELPKSTPILKKIWLDKLPKTEYELTDALEQSLDTTDGVIMREYKDGSKKRIGLVDRYISGWEEACKNAREKGQEKHMLKVFYYEDGILLDCEYEITIKIPAQTTE